LFPQGLLAFRINPEYTAAYVLMGQSSRQVQRMTNSIDYTLAQIYDLIESNDLEQARALLKTLIETDRDNPDVWWLYAHAVTDAETARLALNSVLHLDPDYPQVKDLLSRLNSRIGADETGIGSTGEPTFLTPTPLPLLRQPQTVPLLSEVKSIQPSNTPTSYPDSVATETSSKPFYQRPGCLLIAGLLAAIVLSIVGILRLQDQLIVTPGLPTDTGSTIEATSETMQPLPADLENILQGFSSFTVQNDGIAYEQTSLGQTTVVRICTVPGLEMRAALMNGMETLAQQSINIDPSSNQALAVQLWDCSSEVLLRYIAVPFSVAKAYTGGDLNKADFEASWVPIG
jgi:tetratricopeptide (TPR) repeat protein